MLLDNSVKQSIQYHMMILLGSIIGFLLPLITPTFPLLVLIGLSLMILTIYKENRLISTIFSGFIISILVFRWFISSLDLALVNYALNVKLLPYLSAILFFYFIMHYVKIWKISYIHQKYAYLTIFASFLYIFAFLHNIQSPIVPIKYLGNTIIPYIMQIAITGIILSLMLNDKVSKEFNFLHVWLPTLINVAIIILLIANVLLFILDATGLLITSQFFQDVNVLLRGEKSVGNFTTRLGGIELERWPGILADPILAAYIWTAILFYIEFIWKNFKIKILASSLIIFWLLLSLSKAALLLYALGRIGLFIMRYRINYWWYLIILTTIIVLIGIRSLNMSGLDSSYIHMLGLVLPFTTNDILSFIVGNGLYDAGNLGADNVQYFLNKDGGLFINVAHGAESFVGLIMYSSGIAGVLIYLIYIFLLIKNFMNFNNQISKFIVSVFIPVAFVSFYQENSYNLIYFAIRIILLLSIASLYFYNKENIDA